MAKVYQYEASGYFAGEVDDYGLLPNNATRTAPQKRAGFVPHWNGKKWGLIENHKGKEGYVNDQPCTIKDYGPLPAGWSDTPPPPTLDEMKDKARAALREKRKQIEYGGFEMDGQHWDSAEKDELRLNSVARIFESGVPKYEGWKISEGIYITLTPELAQQAAMAFMRHYGKAFAVEADKLAGIDSLETVETVEAWLVMELTQGW